MIFDFFFSFLFLTWLRFLARYDVLRSKFTVLGTVIMYSLNFFSGCFGDLGLINVCWDTRQLCVCFSSIKRLAAMIALMQLIQQFVYLFLFICFIFSFLRSSGYDRRDYVNVLVDFPFIYNFLLFVVVELTTGFLWERAEGNLDICIVIKRQYLIN